MKFYTGPEDLKDVIERYIVIGNDMAVYYLNNRKVSIPNFTEEQREEIKKILEDCGATVLMYEKNLTPSNLTNTRA